MKLRQKEWCHNCTQEVMFEFEDTSERQVILCPNCGHEHYREIDNATLLDIYVDMTRGPHYIRTCKMPEVSLMDLSSDGNAPMMPLMEIEEHLVIGVNDDGKAMIKPTHKEGEVVEKIVTNRRWGVDPRQGRA